MNSIGFLECVKGFLLKILFSLWYKMFIMEDNIEVILFHGQHLWWLPVSQIMCQWNWFSRDCGHIVDKTTSVTDLIVSCRSEILSWMTLDIATWCFVLVSIDSKRWMTFWYILFNSPLWVMCLWYRCCIDVNVCFPTVCYTGIKYF